MAKKEEYALHTSAKRKGSGDLNYEVAVVMSLESWGWDVELVVAKPGNVNPLSYFMLSIKEDPAEARQELSDWMINSIASYIECRPREVVLGKQDWRPTI